MREALAGLMTAPLGSSMVVLAGGALGLMFYAGLWWTVRGAATFRRPGMMVLGSLLLRMGVTLGGFYLVAGGDMTRLLLCLLGFVLARVVVTWLTRLPSSTSGRVPVAGGAHDAS